MTEVPGVAVDAGGLLDQVIQRSPVGIAVIDADGLFTQVNPAYGALYGYAPAELLGTPVTRILPPEQHRQLLARHRAFLEQGVALDAEWEVLRRDGSRLTVMGYSLRVPGPDGRPSRLVYVVDISQRKQAERALQRSQAFLHSVLDGLTSHVCVLDGDGNIVAVNQAWRAYGQANGGSLVDLAEGCNYLAECDRAHQSASADDEGDPQAFAQQLRAVLAGRLASFQMEYPCQAPASQRWFVARVSRIPGSQPPLTVVAHDDVTTLKQVQQTLGDSEALLRDLAASLPGAMFRLQKSAAGPWRFVYVSPGIQELFGLRPDQVTADLHALTRCILPEDRAAHDASIRAAVAASMPWAHEYRIRRPDGGVAWVQAEATPKPAGGGDVVWTGLLRDISERKRLSEVISASEERYRTLFETVPQGVVYQDAHGRITSANPAAQRILGLSLAQMQGHHAIDPSWQALREDGSPLPADEHPAMRALRSGEPVRNQVMSLAVPQRGRAWLLVNATPLHQNGRVSEVYASFEDITDRVLLSQELKLQASTDDLTGVANRRSLMQRLALEFQRVQQRPGSACAVLAIDIDLFKRVNDQHGHAAGDAVLQHTAALMRRFTRQGDLVARSGGEEFTVLLPDTDAGEAAALAERLRAGLQAQPARHQGPAGAVTLPVTLSAGVSLILPGDTSTDAVLARADAALYEAKAAGRNRVCVAPLPP